MGRLCCRNCSQAFSLDHPIWRCSCGGLLDIEFTAKFPLNQLKRRKPTIWRYREAIPIENSKNIVSLGEGVTPLLTVNLYGKKVLIKQDHLMPSGSFKDRGASVLISKVKELSIKKVVIDSSGNAASAVAAYCAHAGVDCHVFVPEKTSREKLAQIASYGANLIRVKGTREDAAEAALEMAQKTYYASHYWNPFFFQGTKTLAYEICEQLGWHSPDSVVLPVGNGTLILGAYLGFNDLYKSKITNRQPKIIGVQAANCAPIYHAFKEGLTELPQIISRPTMADGVAVANPPRIGQILDAIRNTRGTILAVSEKNIVLALRELAAQGFFVEPTSALTMAGLKEYAKISSQHETIVSIFTGHGLKAATKILEVMKQPAEANKI